MTKSAVAEAPKNTIKVVHEGPVAIEKIKVLSQIRKKFDENALAELTENIRSLGVISPITLRPSPTQDSGEYLIVAGERRFRAAQAAGLTEIPARVLELGERQALEYQAAENIHRRDLTPVEEARAFQLLTQPAGESEAKYTVEQLAPLVDKSLNYVYRALKLLELPEPILEALEAGEITPAHGHQLLRIKPVEALDLLDRAKEYTAANLKETIDNQLGRDLDGATFPKNKEYAGCVACKVCPLNSGNQEMLFDGAEKGRCMDSECFAKKTRQASLDVADSLRKRHPRAVFVKIVTGYVYEGTSLDGFRIADLLERKAEPAKGEYALVVNTQAGNKVWLALPIPKPKASAAGAGQSGGAPRQDPKDNFIQERLDVALLKAVAAKSSKLTKKHLIELVEVASENNDGGHKGAVIEQAIGPIDVTGMTEAELTQALVLSSFTDWQGQIEEDRAEALGVNVRAVEKAARKEAEAAWVVFNAKHKSTANGGSETACGLKGTSYAEDKNVSKVGVAVPDWESTTCAACLKKKPKEPRAK
jgi:ParB/RepB/Spo0J family partition protein